MDLAQFKTASLANEGAVLELRAPDESPLLTEDNTPVTITVLGRDSDVFIKQTNANTNRILKQGNRAKITAEGSRADGIAVLARCTVDWTGIKLDGETLDCTYDNAVKLYTEFPFIREQVDEFIGDRANFLKA